MAFLRLAYGALDVLDCSTRPLEFFRGGFRRVLSRIKLVGELLNLPESVGIHQLALRYGHRPESRRNAQVALFRVVHLQRWALPPWSIRAACRRPPALSRCLERPVLVDVGMACLQLGPLAERQHSAAPLAAELIERADQLMYSAKRARASTVRAIGLRLDDDRLIKTVGWEEHGVLGGGAADSSTSA